MLVRSDMNIAKVKAYVGHKAIAAHAHVTVSDGEACAEAFEPVHADGTMKTQATVNPRRDANSDLGCWPASVGTMETGSRLPKLHVISIRITAMSGSPGR